LQQITDFSKINPVFKIAFDESRYGNHRLVTSREAVAHTPGAL
jgi:hypothetical protein